MANAAGGAIKTAINSCYASHSTRAYNIKSIYIAISQNDDVADLDKLRMHSDEGKDITDVAEKLEDSLKKLHDTNPHHKHEEKPAKVHET